MGWWNARSFIKWEKEEEDGNGGGSKARTLRLTLTLKIPTPPYARLITAWIPGSLLTRSNAWSLFELPADIAVTVDNFRRDLMRDRFWIACSYLAVIEVKRQEFMSSGVLLCLSVDTFFLLYFFFHLRVIFAFTSRFWDLCMLLLCCPCADEYACKFSHTRSCVVVCGRYSSRFSYEHLMF